jgi:hypothetical protein
MPNINLTKLVTNQDTFGEMVEKINSNFDIISQAQGLRGEEGKRGAAGVPGPPGVIGPQGTQGPNGTPGSRWYFGDTFTTFDKTGTNVGDFFLEADTGFVFEKISAVSASQWTNRGSITATGSGGSDLFNIFEPTVNNKTKVIKPIKTNYTLEISDVTGTSPTFIVEPFSVDGADTAEFVLGGSTTTQNWLQEMALKIYTSEGNVSSSIYGDGKNIHLANSTGLIYNKLYGWQNQSGFTLTVNWGGVLNRHEETLKIASVPSGDSNHKQIIDLTANEIQLNSDYTFVNSPITLYSIDKDTIPTGDLQNGMLIYDTDENAVLAYEDGQWVKLSTTSSGSTGYYFDVTRVYDSSGNTKSMDQTADTSTTVLRLKEGSGITIDSVGILEGGTSYEALEIRLSSSSATATDYYGTVRVYDEDGITKFSLPASGNDILELQEGNNVTLTQSLGKIIVNTTSGSGSSSFEGFKYKWGQVGNLKQPIKLNNTHIEYRNIIVQNDGTLADTKPLIFDQVEITKPIYTNVVTDNTLGQTVFVPGKKGFWQFNVFAFGLVEIPEEYTADGILYPYTIAGCITKNSQQHSYISIAESSTISPNAIFGLNTIGETSQFPWPTWTINCSDILQLNDTDRITIGVGGLYAPTGAPNYSYLPGAQLNLWYMSGYVSAVYLGDN